LQPVQGRKHNSGAYDPMETGKGPRLETNGGKSGKITKKPIKKKKVCFRKPAQIGGTSGPKNEKTRTSERLSKERGVVGRPGKRVGNARAKKLEVLHENEGVEGEGEYLGTRGEACVSEGTIPVGVTGRRPGGKPVCTRRKEKPYETNKEKPPQNRERCKCRQKGMQKDLREQEKTGTCHRSKCAKKWRLLARGNSKVLAKKLSCSRGFLGCWQDRNWGRSGGGPKFFYDSWGGSFLSRVFSGGYRGVFFKQGTGGGGLVELKPLIHPRGRLNR